MLLVSMEIIKFRFFLLPMVGIILNSMKKCRVSGSWIPDSSLILLRHCLDGLVRKEWSRIWKEILQKLINSLHPLAMSYCRTRMD